MPASNVLLYCIIIALKLIFKCCTFCYTHWKRRRRKPWNELNTIEQFQKAIPFIKGVQWRGTWAGLIGLRGYVGPQRLGNTNTHDYVWVRLWVSVSISIYFKLGVFRMPQYVWQLQFIFFWLIEITGQHVQPPYLIRLIFSLFPSLLSILHASPPQNPHHLFVSVFQ